MIMSLTTAQWLRVATWQVRLPHKPHAEHIRAAYAALCKELDRQFSLLCAFVDVQFTAVDPYPGSAAMFADLEDGRLSVFTGGFLQDDHLLTRMSPHGHLYNHIFRAVHDGLAHFPERNQFGPIGELAAFRAHARLTKGSTALQALAFETVAHTAVYETTKCYAEQKCNLLPLPVVRWLLIREDDHEANV